MDGQHNGFRYAFQGLRQCRISTYMETGVLMKALLLFLASPLFGALTVSNVYLNHVSHGSTLVNFTVANNAPNGDGSLWNFARICYATASGGCVSGTGRKYMPTGYPNDQSID